jgi:hypothetical protein
MDIIDVTKDHLPAIAEHRRKPQDAEAADKEDMVSHAMFEYYTRLYADNPEWYRTQYLTNVAAKFGKSQEEVESLYTRFRWFSRAKKVIFENKNLSALPKDATEALEQMLVNTNLIASLGTRFVTDFLTTANPSLMTPKDVYKIGMLVVECIRVSNEVKGGTPGQAQGQVINLVINE